MFINMEARTGVEPIIEAYETSVIPFHYLAINWQEVSESNAYTHSFGDYGSTIKLTPCGGECRGRTCKTLFNVHGLANRCNTIIRTHLWC